MKEKVIKPSVKQRDACGRVKGDETFKVQ